MAGRGTGISRAGRIVLRHGRRARVRDVRLAGLQVAPVVPAAGRQAVARRATWVAARRAVRRRVRVDVPRAAGLQVDSLRAAAVDLPAAASHRVAGVDARRVVGAVDRVHALQVAADKADGRQAAVRRGSQGVRRRVTT